MLMYEGCEGLFHVFARRWYRTTRGLGGEQANLVLSWWQVLQCYRSCRYKLYISLCVRVS